MKKKISVCAALLVCLCTGTVSAASVLPAAAVCVGGTAPEAASETIAESSFSEEYLTDAVAAVAPAAAKLVVQDGLMFDVASGSAVLLYVLEDKAEIKIPDTVSGLPVTGIVASDERAVFTGSVIQKVTIPASVTNIQTYQLLDNCTSLKSFSVAGGNETYCTKDGIIYSKDSKTLIKYPPAHGTSFSVPKGTETIGHSAFTGSTALKSVTVPASVKLIDRQAFKGCSALSALNLTKGLSVVESEAFAQCTALDEIILPMSVTSICHAAFDGCTASNTYILNPNCTVYSSDRTLPKNTQSASIIHAMNNSKVTSYFIKFWSGREFYALDNYDSRFLPIFLKNGGGSGTMETLFIDTKVGSLTLPECAFNSPTGKTFAGWQVGGQLLQPGDTVSADSFPVKPYEIAAVWLAPGERPGGDTSKTVPGDLNNDGLCNKADAEIMLGYLSSRTATVNYPPADLDGDARITAKDLTLLKQLI